MVGHFSRRLAALLLVGGFLGSVLSALPAAQPEESRTPTPRMERDHLVGPSNAVSPGWSAVVTGGADLVGVQWDGDPDAQFAVESRDDKGQWSEAGTVGRSDVLADPGSDDTRNAPAPYISDPVWVNDATSIRLRVVSGSVRGLSLDRITVPPATSSSGTASAAVPAQPGIVSRAQWGADESLRLANCPSGPSYDARVQLAVVHHTVNANDYSPGESARLVRSIYAYHTLSLGYCDIAYNFLIDRFGVVFEGRYGGIAEPVRGAHAIGFNTSTTGVALIGDYQRAAPTSAAINALDSLLAWKLAISNVNVAAPVAYTTAGNSKFAPGTYVVPAVIGHRDTWFTSCPGANLVALLPSIRADVASRVAAAPPSYWHGWGALGGTLTSAPSAASRAPGSLDVFVRGTDNGLYNRVLTGAGWSGWGSLGGVLTSDPAAVSWGPGRIDVFVRGTDNGLYHALFANGGWSGWEALGGYLTSAPTVASWSEGRLDVFVRGSDNGLYHLFFQGGWSGWESLGGGLTAAPAAVSWVSGRIDVFARGTDNALYHMFYAGGWSGWESLGGYLTSAPTVASWSEGRLDVFVRGSDNGLYQRFYQGGWSGWGGLGGFLTSAPGAVSWQPSRIDVFVAGGDAGLYHRAYSSNLYP